MIVKNKSAPDKELRVRVSKFDLDLIDAFCKTQNRSRTKTIKNAIKSYIYLNVENKERPNQKVLFSQNMLKPLLDNADEDLIEKVAQISYDNGMADSELLKKTLNTVGNEEKSPDIRYPLIKSLSFDDLEDRVQMLIQGVFSPDAQNWFESIKYGWNDKILIVGGRHNMGKNFSVFFKFLMIKYMDFHDYKLKKDDYRETKVKNPVYTVILHFKPK